MSPALETKKLPTPATFSKGEAHLETKKLPTPATFSKGEARRAYDEATQAIQFTREPNASLDAIISDKMASNGERFMAWLKRRAWGNYRLWAVLDDGTPAIQRDCATELGIHKSRLSHIVSYYEHRGYVELLGGKFLCPVLAPQLAGPEVARSSEYKAFVENWKVAHSADFSEMEVARSVIKRINKVILSAYKMTRKSRAAETISAPSLRESSRVSESKDEGATDRPLQVETAVVIREPVRSAGPTLREVLRAWLVGKFALPYALEPDVFNEIARHIPDELVFEQFCTAAAEVEPRGWKMFIKIAERCEANREQYAAVAAHAGAGNGFQSRGTREAMALIHERIARGEDPL